MRRSRRRRRADGGHGTRRCGGWDEAPNRHGHARRKRLTTARPRRLPQRDATSFGKTPQPPLRRPGVARRRTDKKKTTPPLDGLERGSFSGTRAAPGTKHTDSRGPRGALLLLAGAASNVHVGRYGGLATAGRGGKRVECAEGRRDVTRCPSSASARWASAAPVLRALDSHFEVVGAYDPRAAAPTPEETVASAARPRR